MTEMKLTLEEFLRIELHYSESRNLKLQKDIMIKEKEGLKNKAQIALLIKQNAELEIINKDKRLIEFGETIKSHQKAYETGLKEGVKKRLKIKPSETFAYSPDTLEVTIREETEIQTE